MWRAYRTQVVKQEKYVEGFAEKTPGVGFFPPFLIEPSRKKNPPPGAFPEFFYYYSDYQSYIDKITVF